MTTRFCTMLAFALMVASSASGATPGNTIACDALRNRFLTERGSENDRKLNFFLFDAAERGCGELVEQFLDAGASISARDRFGNTALLHAARMGHTELVERLIGYGSAIDHANLAGSTSILRAVTMNRRKTVEWLLANGADPNNENLQGITPLLAASFNGNNRLVQILLATKATVDHADRTGKSGIIYAAAKGYSEIVELFLDAGIEPNRRYGHQLTALMWAAGYSNDVPAKDAVTTIELMLDRGADVDYWDDRGRSALMIASERGHTEVVELLASRGADLSLTDAQGLSAADLTENLEILTLLTQQQAQNPAR